MQVRQSPQVAGAAALQFVGVEAGVVAVAVVVQTSQSCAQSGIHPPAARQQEAISYRQACHQGVSAASVAEVVLIEFAAAHAQADVGATETVAAVLQPVADFGACAPGLRGVGGVAESPHAVGSVGGNGPSPAQIDFHAQIGGEHRPRQQVAAQCPARSGFRTVDVLCLRPADALRFRFALGTEGAGGQSYRQKCGGEDAEGQYLFYHADCDV